MSTTTLLLSVLLLLIYSIVAHAAPDFVIGGYLPDYRFYINLNQTLSAGYTDVYLFSVDPIKVQGETILEGNCCLNDAQMKQIEAARVYYNEQVRMRQESVQSGNKATASDETDNIVQSAFPRLWLTLGGAGRSSGFHVPRSYDQRMALYEHLYKTVVHYKLDGIDWDCEQFGRSQDYHNYLLVLREASRYFKSKYNEHEKDAEASSSDASTTNAGSDAKQATNNPRTLMSVTLHAGQSLPADVYPLIDRIHLMAYDMRSPQGSDVKYHANITQVKQAVRLLITQPNQQQQQRQGQKQTRMGPLPSQVVLGIPAYGRHFENPGLVKTYAELYDAISKARDKKARKQDGEWEWKDIWHKWQGYYFESGAMARQKVEYAQEENLAGVFVWEIGQDKATSQAPGGLLLRALADAKASLQAQDSANESDEL
jgi:GH18 family chitinase